MVATSTWSPDGTYMLNYTGFIAPLVKAVQEIATITDTFKANLIAWLGWAQNGIVDLFAKNIYATNITANHGSFREITASSTVSDSGTFGKLCVDDLCVTRDQLAAILSAS